MTLFGLPTSPTIMWPKTVKEWACMTLFGLPTSPTITWPKTVEEWACMTLFGLPTSPTIMWPKTVEEWAYMTLFGLQLPLPSCDPKQWRNGHAWLSLDFQLPLPSCDPKQWRNGHAWLSLDFNFPYLHVTQNSGGMGMHDSLWTSTSSTIMWSKTVEEWACMTLFGLQLPLPSCDPKQWRNGHAWLSLDFNFPYHHVIQNSGGMGMHDSLWIIAAGRLQTHQHEDFSFPYLHTPLPPPPSSVPSPRCPHPHSLCPFTPPRSNNQENELLLLDSHTSLCTCCFYLDPT